jgi:hypothetical protein
MIEEGKTAPWARYVGGFGRTDKVRDLVGFSPRSGTHAALCHIMADIVPKCLTHVRLSGANDL